VPLVSELDELDVEPVSVLAELDAACAATPAAMVPARLAATSATVMVVVNSATSGSLPGSLALACADPEPSL
jgi:hypothetical protein